MALELFVKKTAMTGSPFLTVRDGRIALNADATDILVGAGVKFAHILWDSDACRIAIKSVKKPDQNSFKMSCQRGKRGGTFSVKVFLKHIQWQAAGAISVPVSWNGLDLQLEATLPKEHIGSADTPRRSKK